MMYTVGSVPYLNAKPLVRYFEDLGEESPVKVLYAVPALLPAMLAEGTVQAIMVSSIESLRKSGNRVAYGVCIGTREEVLSVRVFSKVPANEIKTIAWDQSSMTSNALAQIVLKETYGVEPSGLKMKPDLQQMLANHDACVLIGDNGMREIGEGLTILDLGQEWFNLTKLPFVWAVWLGGESLTQELAEHLVHAEVEGQRRMDRIVADAPGHTQIPLDMCDLYLRQIMHYPMFEHELEGLREFGRRLEAHGIIKEAHFPEFVGRPLSEPTKVSAG